MEHYCVPEPAQGIVNISHLIQKNVKRRALFRPIIQMTEDKPSLRSGYLLLVQLHVLQFLQTLEHCVEDNGFQHLVNGMMCHVSCLFILKG